MHKRKIHSDEFLNEKNTERSQNSLLPQGTRKHAKPLKQPTGINVMIKTTDVGKRLENISGMEFLKHQQS